MPPPTIRNRIREFREANGNVTQEELAAALDISRQTVISIEKLRYTPGLGLAWQIAAYFGRPIEEVFYEDDSTNTNGTRG